VKDEKTALKLGNVLLSDAAEIFAARAKASVIHNTKDIRASGDEVERAVRKVLKRKLPTAYYVGHGHVVDSELTTSPQLDIVIADNLNAPVLFATENGTEYFPYESVYAIGEIKTCYYKKKREIHAFSKTLTSLKTKLKREKTEREYIGSGLSLGKGFTPSWTDEYRNPLFSFMLFVDSGDFDDSHVKDLFRSTKASELPNVVCFLNKGVIVNARVTKLPNGGLKLGSVNTHPELDISDESDSRWVFIPFGTDSSRMGIIFGFLYFCLLTHLKRCVLRTPNLLQYLNRFFTYQPVRTIN
jgi:hypothetical protein